MRLAYADPPYPGNAKLYKGHPDYAGEVDHERLIHDLETYDGWALSTSEQALQEVLELCPRKTAGIKGRRYRSFSGVRVVVWAKGGGTPFPREGMHAWEPIIVRGARPPAVNLRDWIVCEPEYFQWRAKPADYVIGQKPEPVARFIFRWLGAEPGDELVDVFPGSGSVSRAWRSFTEQAELDLAPPRPKRVDPEQLNLEAAS